MRNRQKKQANVICSNFLTMLIIFCMVFSLCTPVLAADSDQPAPQKTEIFGFSGNGEENNSDNAEDTDQNRKVDDIDENGSDFDTAAKTLVYRGSNYTVTAMYPEGALPETARLQVREIRENTRALWETAEYQKYLEQAREMAKEEQRAVSDARFFDITFLAEETEERMEPAAPVDVRIEFDNAEILNEGTEVQTVHLPENAENTVIESTLNEMPTENGSIAYGDTAIENNVVESVSFTAESFSVYGVLYTVDFWYGEYEYHLNGEGEIMVSALLKELGLLDAEETGNAGAENTSEKQSIRMADVVDVRFSDESLVKVTREDQADGTADWKLTSLKAFDTEETLTIELKNGQVIEVRVTDAQYVCQIKNGNNVTGQYESLEAAFAALPNNAARTIELLTDCTVNSPVSYTGNADNRTLTIKPAAGVQNPVIYRGSTTGDLITLNRGYLVLENITIDGNNKVSTGALVKTTATSNRLTLTNVVVQNHKSSNSICAIEASYCRYVYLSGSTKITGNTNSSGAANLHVPDNPAYTVISGVLSEDIGITSVNNANKLQFAAVPTTLRDTSDVGQSHLKADDVGYIYGSKDGILIKWSRDAVSGSNIRPRNMVADPNYGKAHTPGKNPTDYPSVVIPLTKSFEINGDFETVRTQLVDEEFEFEITADSSNPAGGAEISQPESIKVSAATILNETPVDGKYEYTNNPWAITFSKEGTYKFSIAEKDGSNTSKNYQLTYDTTPDEFEFHVVKEEGILRIAEEYRSEQDTISAEQYGSKLDNIPSTKLFNVETAIDGNGSKATVNQSGGEITLNMYQNSAAVITSVFSLDFSRSFEVKGTAQVPADDCLTIAFQDNPMKEAFYTECTNALDPVYYGGNRNMVIGGYTVDATTADKQGNTIDSMNEGFILQYVSKNTVRGFYSYQISGNSRIPYAASSGLTEGTGANAKTYDSKVTENNNTCDFSIKFECSNHDTGAGKLTIKMMNHEVVYNNFVASTLMPNIWQQAFLTPAANVDNGCHGQIVLKEESYQELLSSENTTSFWADRNDDGVFETQVNTTNSPAVPGETILVRHSLKRSDTYSNTYYERALIRQLRDATAKTNLTGTDAHTYPTGTLSSSVICDNTANAYNNDSMSNGMWLAAFPGSDGFNFEYKVTAPSKNDHYVTEQAMFGQEPFQTLYTDSYGFRTENIEEQKARFENSAATYTVTYNPDGGKFSDNSTGNKTVSALNGSEHTALSAPTKSGYTFTGWKKDDMTTYDAGDTFTVTSDVTLTAQWKEFEIPVVTKTYELGDFEHATQVYSGTFKPAYDGDISVQHSVTHDSSPSSIPQGYVYGTAQIGDVKNVTYINRNGTFKYTDENDAEQTGTIQANDTLTVYYYTNPITVPVYWCKVDSTGKLTELTDEEANRYGTNIKNTNTSLTIYQTHFVKLSKDQNSGATIWTPEYLPEYQGGENNNETIKGYPLYEFGFGSDNSIGKDASALDLFVDGTLYVKNTPEGIYVANAESDPTNKKTFVGTDTAIYIIYQVPEEPTVPLTITKQVTGEMGDVTKNFTFTMTVADAADEDSFTTSKSGTEGTIKSGETFTLKDGENITINLPKGKLITLAETDADYYTTTVAGEAYAGLAAAPQVNGHTVSLIIADDATEASVTVTNNLNDIAPTGLTFRFLPWILIALAGGALLVVFRRRRNA